MADGLFISSQIWWPTGFRWGLSGRRLLRTDNIRRTGRKQHRRFPIFHHVTLRCVASVSCVGARSWPVTMGGPACPSSALTRSRFFARRHVGDVFVVSRDIVQRKQGIMLVTRCYTPSVIAESVLQHSRRVRRA